MAKKRVKTATLVFDLLLPFDFYCHVLSLCGLDFHRHHFQSTSEQKFTLYRLQWTFFKFFFLGMNFAPFLVRLISRLKFCSFPKKLFPAQKVWPRAHKSRQQIVHTKWCANYFGTGTIKQQMFAL